MGCRTCGQYAPVSTPSLSSNSATPSTGEGVVVAKSETPNLVRLRYYGGGTSQKKTSGCRACGGGGGYTVMTSETIMFVSDDAPNGLFKQTFQIGHDYYVTRNQADYLLTLTFRSKAGIVQNKFKEV